MEFEYRIAATYLPTVTARGSGGAGQGIHHRREPRRARRGAREEGRAAAVGRHAAQQPSRARARRRWSRGRKRPTDARWSRSRSGGRQGHRAPHGAGDWRDRADAVERRRGVAQAHRLQERSDPVLGVRARRHVARAPRPSYKSAEPRHRDGRRRRHGRIQPRRSEQDAVRQDRAGVAVDRRIHARHQRLGHAEGSRDRAAAELPRAHRAEHDAGGARAAEAPPDRRAAEPRSESARGVRREGRAGQHVESLQRARR